VFVVTRMSQHPEGFAETLRKLVRATHPELAFDNIRSMDTRIAESLIARRSPALLAGIFAGVALLLAAIGTYGVLSYAVAQRTREIGIRMALGAQRGQIGAQFLSLGLRLLAAGTILGLIGAIGAGRAMQSILFAVPTLHLATFAGTAALMAVVSIVACLLPARRAMKVDPMVALRYE
ncbi:MAG: FtsX-like permease family protein, partial [Chthoniobacterales bacterium]|nr:FtsX-like permease family protein [Chthoniobacterales bacterium]